MKCLQIRYEAKEQRIQRHEMLLNSIENFMNRRDHYIQFYVVKESKDPNKLNRNLGRHLNKKIMSKLPDRLQTITHSKTHKISHRGHN